MEHRTIEPSRKRWSNGTRLLTSSSAVLAVALLGISCLAGCSVSASARPSPTTAKASATADTPNTQRLQGAVTCAVLETVLTNVENARAAHDSGKLSDEADAAIINTVSSSLAVLQSNANAGLQDNVRDLAVDLSQTPPKIPGAAFDPDSAPFANSMSQATAACEKNGTPIGILAPSGQG